MHYPEKSFFMVYVGSYDCYENQNIHKGNDCKVELRFVNCCSLVIVLSNEGYQIILLFSTEQISLMPFNYV